MNKSLRPSMLSRERHASFVVLNSASLITSILSEMVNTFAWDAVIREMKRRKQSNNSMCLTILSLSIQSNLSTSQTLRSIRLAKMCSLQERKKFHLSLASHATDVDQGRTRCDISVYHVDQDQSREISLISVANASRVSC